MVWRSGSSVPSVPSVHVPSAWVACRFLSFSSIHIFQGTCFHTFFCSSTAAVLQSVCLLASSCQLRLFILASWLSVCLLSCFREGQESSFVSGTLLLLTSSCLQRLHPEVNLKDNLQILSWYRAVYCQKPEEIKKKDSKEVKPQA